jgi:hypothetical protein
MIYTAGNNACWIKVVAYSNHFRASTNNSRIYALIDERLRFRHNQADAQADLDALASEFHFTLVKEAENDHV